jgi:hypothetical protein
LKNRGLVLGLLLEFSPENKDLRGNPQMKSRGLVLRAITGDAL